MVGGFLLSPKFLLRTIPRMRRLTIAIIILSGVLLVSCGKLPTSRKPRIQVAAPAFLQPIFDRAAAQFYSENGIIVNMTYLPQVGFQKAIDSTFSADLLFFLNPERQKYFKKNTYFAMSSLTCPFRISLVIANRADGPPLKHVSDLKNSTFRRVAIISPEPNYEGMLARTALKKYGIWDDLQSKLILAESGEHLLSFLETGEADAVVCLEHTLKDYRQAVIRYRFDEFYGDQLNVCGLLAAGESSRKASAQAFLDFFYSLQNSMYDIPGVIRID